MTPPGLRKFKVPGSKFKETGRLVCTEGGFYVAVSIQACFRAHSLFSFAGRVVELFKRFAGTGPLPSR